MRRAFLLILFQLLSMRSSISKVDLLFLFSQTTCYGNEAEPANSCHWGLHSGTIQNVDNAMNLERPSPHLQAKALRNDPFLHNVMFFMHYSWCRATRETLLIWLWITVQRIMKDIIAKPLLENRVMKELHRFNWEGISDLMNCWEV